MGLSKSHGLIGSFIGKSLLYFWPSRSVQFPSWMLIKQLLELNQQFSPHSLLNQQPNLLPSQQPNLLPSQQLNLLPSQPPSPQVENQPPSPQARNHQVQRLELNQELNLANPLPSPLQNPPPNLLRNPPPSQLPNQPQSQPPNQPQSQPPNQPQPKKTHHNLK
jgi:hypothetical protein